MYSPFAWLEASGLGPEGWIRYAKLMFVLGVIFAAFLIVRWLATMIGPGRSASQRIRIVARLSLEPRRTLYVVGVGKDFMLMASSDAGVELMTKLDPDEWAESQSDLETRTKQFVDQSDPAGAAS